MKSRYRVIVGSDEKSGDETMLLKVFIDISTDSINESPKFFFAAMSEEYRARALVKTNRIHVTENLKDGLKGYVAFDRSPVGVWSFRRGVVVDEDEEGWLIQGSCSTYREVVFDSEKILDLILGVTLKDKTP